MNIMDTLLLQQMQQMAAGMTALPQTGSKDKSGEIGRASCRERV